jgi:hypothetical protein
MEEERILWEQRLGTPFRRQLTVCLLRYINTVQTVGAAPENVTFRDKKYTVKFSLDLLILLFEFLDFGLIQHTQIFF